MSRGGGCSPLDALERLGATEDDLHALLGASAIVRAFAQCAERDEMPMHSADGLHLAAQAVRDVAEAMTEGVDG